MFEADLAFEDRDGRSYPCPEQELTVPSGRAGTWILRLRCLDQPLATGSVIAVERYNIHFAYAFQTEWPQRRDYVTVETTGHASLAFESRLDRDWRITVRDGTVDPGDVITVRLGDRRHGSVGSETFWSSTRGRLTFQLVLPDGGTSKLADDVLVRVIHRETPARARLLGPSRIRPDTPFSLLLVVFDLDCNVVETWEGGVRFQACDVVSGLPSERELVPGDRGMATIEGVSVSHPAIVRIRAMLGEEELECVSNPIECAAHDTPGIYWGELHAHGWGDDSMLLMHDRTEKLDPHARHAQARRVGRYDYGAPGAMAMPQQDDERQRIWQAYLDAWHDHDLPGSYVPFMAMEMHPRKGGDWTLIFRDEGELPPAYRTPVEEVFERYGDRKDAFLEGHLGGSAPKFRDYLPAPGRVRLIEVASAFGGAEWILQDALARGYRPAITGASDLHLGLMGAPRAVETFRGRFGRELNVRDAAFGSGPVGAIMADRLERGALWQALNTRQTYATTGARILVDLAVDGYGMGVEASFPAQFPVCLRVHGETDIERIDLIVGDRLGDQHHPDGPDVEWRFTYDRDVLPRASWFYFRIKQRDNEFAWTAPVFFMDGSTRGTDPSDWSPWNAIGPADPVPSDALRRYAAELERYLETEGDREKFGELRPLRIADESYGRCALVLSTWLANGWPVTLRWFADYEIPKIRVDYGYEMFGVTNCEAGPAGPPPIG